MMGSTGVLDRVHPSIVGFTLLGEGCYSEGTACIKATHSCDGSGTGLDNHVPTVIPGFRPGESVAGIG